MLEIKARQKRNVIILDLCGRIDSDSANLIEIVGQCVKDGYTDILCNFETVESIDYLGVSAIVIAYKEIVNNKGRMKFCNIPLHLKTILGVAAIAPVISITPPKETALTVSKKIRLLKRYPRCS